MKRKNEIIKKTEEWATFNAIFYRMEKNPHGSESQRVEHIIELLSTLGGPLSDFKKKAETLPELRRSLSRYQWVRRVEPTQEGWRSVTMPKFEVISASEKWEYEAISALLDLAERPDGLSRIRRCEIEKCSRWLYASAKIGQRWCSDKCKVSNYDNNEERKEKKKLAMRESRKREKERDARAKRKVNFSEKKLNKLLER